MTPLRLSDLTSPLMAARLKPLLFRRGQDWYGVIAPSDLADPERFAATMRDAGATFVDVSAEANNVVAAYTATAWHWFGFGALAALVAVAVGLRDVRRVISVAGAIAGAVVMTVAILSAIGTRLSLLHIVSLQFVIGQRKRLFDEDGLPRLQRLAHQGGMGGMSSHDEDRVQRLVFEYRVRRSRGVQKAEPPLRVDSRQ